MNLKGSRTEKNLLAAFAGESQARNRYTYFASRAKRDGYEQIYSIFIETAENEKEHAKRFFNLMEGGEAAIEMVFPAGPVRDTYENLISSAHGENEEHTRLYPEAASVAEEEGFREIAVVFRRISEVEKAHEARFLTLAGNIRSGRVFKRDKETRWKCLNCGYIHTGKEAPDTCPACLHPKSYYELAIENY